MRRAHVNCLFSGVRTLAHLGSREPIRLLKNCVGFEWNDENATKNWDRHQVSKSEAEQVFFNQPLIVSPDIVHSKDESRYYLLGQTDFGRRLFVVFTIIDERIRVISARDMSKKERKVFENEEIKDPQV